jgi:radical SAM superfamily enzyme YgiQ (UPF0313 family)/glycosyltransferase involved in cell wall biosynthesis
LGYQKEAAGSDVSRLANIMPPLGLASISAFLDTQGIDSFIIDCFAHPESDLLIRDYLLEKRPAFIGLSCTTSSFLDGVRIAKFGKSILPNLQVVFGGPHVSAKKEKTLEDYPIIDFCVVGEGEQTLTELVKSSGQEAATIPGVVFRDLDGHICFTGYRSDRIDLDTLPFPAYEKLDGYPAAYKLPIFNYPKVPNSSCISSRGCPYSCSYCDRSVFQRSFRYNSAEYLYEHLRYLKERFGIRHINFYDDQFTFNRKRVETFARMMIDKPQAMTFNCAVRAEHIDPELLHLMKAAGCWMISLGIETGDEELLTQHRKHADLDLLAEKIRLIKKEGIRTKGLFMLGLPGETEMSIKKSMDYLFSLPIDDLNLTKFTPFPGTPLYEKIHELGEFDEDWEKMDCMHFLFIPKGMTKERMEKLFLRFYRTHFMRPKVLLNYLSMLWRSPDSWFRFIRHLKKFVKFAGSNKRLGGAEVQGSRSDTDIDKKVPHQDLNIMIVIPVYNHTQTLRNVLERTLKVHDKVLVVDDGSTDHVSEVISEFNVRFIQHDKNKGKGAAIRTGAREAHRLGMTHIITIDADGQHDPADFRRFVPLLKEDPRAIIIGKRLFQRGQAPRSSIFGRSFSNFWMRLQTGQIIGDTQSGFRAYPLNVLNKLKLKENHYSFEVEALVKAAWAGVNLREVDISVHYPPPEKRISHFRKFMDNFRLGLLNARLTMRSALPVPHRKIVFDTQKRDTITVIHPLRSLRTLLTENTSSWQLAAAGALGVFLGALPLIACHTIAIIFAASFFRLNKVVALCTSQLCMPPIVPALCIEMGYYMRHGHFLTDISLETIGYQALERLYEWFIGSLVLGPIMGILVASIILLMALGIKRSKRAVTR